MPDTIPSITSLEHLVQEASRFIDLYWDEIQPDENLHTRKIEILAEIHETGTWTPTFPELEYGARVAWRNTNKCIGRYFWKSLQVRDCRHISDAQGIFDECLEHLTRATNNGNIRSVLTVFPETRATATPIRIWNYQLMGYAGWQAVIGKRLGDPLHDDFTAQAVAFGWVPPNNPTDFDLLPIIITDGAGEIATFDLPRDRVREVKISHPDHADMLPADLRWYAVPLMTNMCLYIGGLTFSAAPFNGFYMGTEIGARDLADEDRYNLLPSIAEKLHLDRSSNATLWKDRALLELNVAVLHSFRRDQVTIIDHHTASHTFMQHIESEKREGREVTGDWSWLIPPMSPATTKVFHRYYDDTVNTPNFFHQSKLPLGNMIDLPSS